MYRNGRHDIRIPTHVIPVTHCIKGLPIHILLLSGDKTGPIANMPQPDSLAKKMLQPMERQKKSIEHNRRQYHIRPRNLIFCSTFLQ